MKERKTALVLSGGGSRGAYEVGVWQALTELGINIDLVVGVSVGAINGAMVSQGDVAKTCNLWRQMETDMVFDVNGDAKMEDFAKEFIVHKGAGTTGLQRMLKKYVDEKAVRNSPVDFGLLTVELPTMTPHYLWKDDIPAGLLVDYITASASAFPAVRSHKISEKEFIDGGYHDNLPVLMAVDRGATHTIAVYLNAIGKFRPEDLKSVPNLTFIESKWDLGDFLVFNIENSKRILRLGYLDAMKTFGAHDGYYYTFVKGDFDKRSLKQADCAAKLFHLDPLILYRKDNFITTLEEAVTKALDEMDIQFDLSDLSLASITSLAPLTTIKEIVKATNRKSVTVLIAQNLKAKGTDSIFLSKYGTKMMPLEINAAKFLVKYKLI